MKTASDEVLQDELYSTLDGDISTITRGVTNITNIAKCEL